MDALTSCRRKIDRAHVHLFPLLAVVERFLTLERPYAISKDYEPESRRYSFKIAQLAGLDEVNLGLMAGDVVHNLRSALDHLVFGLASRRPSFTRSDWNDASFPISDSYRSFMTHSAIRHLALEEIAVVKRYQPFEGRDNKRLIDLHSLWNADKHRVIQSVLVALPQSGIHFRMNEDAGEIVDRGIVAKITLDSNAMNQWRDLGWIEVSAPGPEPDVDVDPLTVEIALGERRVPVRSLAEISTLVADIVEACAAFFPEADTGL